MAQPGPEHPAPPDDEDRGPIGPFPSWTALYATVIVYTLGLVALLAWLTVALDHGLGS